MITVGCGGDSKTHLPEIYFPRPHLLYLTSLLKKYEMPFMICTQLRPDLLEHLRDLEFNKSTNSPLITRYIDRPFFDPWYSGNYFF
jgi:hypothetical protein